MGEIYYPRPMTSMLLNSPSLKFVFDLPLPAGIFYFPVSNFCRNWPYIPQNSKRRICMEFRGIACTEFLISLLVQSETFTSTYM
jgi:hypothetical protein